MIWFRFTVMSQLTPIQGSFSIYVYWNEHFRTIAHTEETIISTIVPFLARIGSLDGYKQKPFKKWKRSWPRKKSPLARLNKQSYFTYMHELNSIFATKFKEPWGWRVPRRWRPALLALTFRSIYGMHRWTNVLNSR